MNNEFGEYIRKLRNERNLTLRQLAEKIGISSYYLSYLETGKKTNPDIKIIANLFIALKMDKAEMELFLDYHAKANGCVSYDIVDFIMENETVRADIRSARDEPGSSPNWDDFIGKISK